jgi:hypothetical protein
MSSLFTNVLSVIQLFFENDIIIFVALINLFDCHIVTKDLVIMPANKFNGIYVKEVTRVKRLMMHSILLLELRVDFINITSALQAMRLVGHPS